MNKRKILLTISEKTEEMAKDIRDKLGYTALTHVFQHAIAELHAKELPPYMKKIESRRTPFQKEKELTARQKARESLKESSKMDILKILGGRVYVTGTHKIAKWYTYSMKQRYEQEMPLMALTEELITNQFSPTREIVEKYQVIKDHE